MKAVKYIYFLFTYLPFVWLVLFIAFAIRATVKLGHSPIPSLNDPKDLGFDIHHNLIWFLFLALIYVVPLYWGTITVLSKLKGWKDFDLLRNSFIFLAGGLAIFCLLHFDPYRLTMWFAD